MKTYTDIYEGEIEMIKNNLRDQFGVYFDDLDIVEQLALELEANDLADKVWKHHKAVNK